MGQSPVQVLPSVDVVASPIVGESTVKAFGFQTTTMGVDQITALNAQDRASALRRTPGAAIARNNPVGAFGGGEGGAVFLRGLGSSRPGGEIETTIDGVPSGNGVFNHPLLDLIPVDLAGGVQVSRRAEPLATGNMFAGINLVTQRVPEAGAFARWIPVRNRARRGRWHLARKNFASYLPMLGRATRGVAMPACW